MNEISITRQTVRIKISGWDKIWSFKGSLAIPVNSIRSVCRHDGKLKPPMLRCPGTALPGVIIAGTYYGKGRKEFWNTRFRGAVVFDLEKAEYTRIVVDVEQPERTIAEVEAMLSRPAA